MSRRQAAQPQPLAGLAHDLGRLAVDQFHRRQAQLGLGEITRDAVDGITIEVAAELVVPTDQTRDGIAHGVKDRRT